MTKLGAEMRDFLNESDLTERRTFVKEIVVMPGDALLRYTVPMPDDSLIPGRDAEEVALPGSVLSTIHDGGHGRTRTNDLSLIRTALEPPELQAHFSLNYQTCSSNTIPSHLLSRAIRLSLRGAQPLMVSLSNHVAISLRLNTRRQITIATATRLPPPYQVRGRNDKTGKTERP